jgi:hypothetical protein
VADRRPGRRPLLTIEAAADGTFPAEIALDQAGIFVGASDQRVPLIRRRYVRTEDTATTPTYQYLGTDD